MRSFVSKCSSPRGLVAGRSVSGPLPIHPTKMKVSTTEPTRHVLVPTLSRLCPSLETLPSRVGAKTWRLPPRSFPRRLLHNLVVQERAPSPSMFDRFARMIDAIYRFLASLKLAVISISTLAATLAYATFFESWYGAGAAQQYIYRSPGFAILLAFLGMNILCAALIRYPWKKRQTGFVVTHAGLLDPAAWLVLQRANRRRGTGRHARGRREKRAGPHRLSGDPDPRD